MIIWWYMSTGALSAVKGRKTTRDLLKAVYRCRGRCSHWQSSPCASGVEYYKGKPIVYSLGNFIFGSSIPKTALLKVQWDGQASQLTFVPGTSSAGYTRVLENEVQKADFASYMTGISYGVTIEDDGTVVPQG